MILPLPNFLHASTRTMYEFPRSSLFFTCIKCKYPKILMYYLVDHYHALLRGLWRWVCSIACLRTDPSKVLKAIPVCLYHHPPCTILLPYKAAGCTKRAFFLFVTFRTSGPVLMANLLLILILIRNNLNGLSPNRCKAGLHS